MSRTYKDRDKHIRVQAVRKDPADLRRLARAVIAFAQAQAEADAQAAGTATALIGKSNVHGATNGKVKVQVTANNTAVAVNRKTTNITATTTPAVFDDDTTDDGDAA